MIEDWETPDVDERTIELLRKLDAEFKRGPKPIEGKYSRTHGRETSFRAAAMFAIGLTSSRTALEFSKREVMLIPIRNTTVAVMNAGTEHEHYQVMGTDEFHYPFKGLVDWVRDI